MELLRVERGQVRGARETGRPEQRGLDELAYGHSV